MVKKITLTEACRELGVHNSRVRFVLRHRPGIGVYDDQAGKWIVHDLDALKVALGAGSLEVSRAEGMEGLKLSAEDELLQFLKNDPDLKLRRQLIEVDPALECLVFARSLAEEMVILKRLARSEIKPIVGPEGAESA